MDNQTETTDRQPKRRGFFARPAGVDYWRSVGGRFWGGLLMGIGMGQLFVGPVVKDLLPDSGPWLMITWVVFMSIGVVVTNRAVNRSAAPGTERSQTR